MGLWSSIKKAVKKAVKAVVHAVKGFVRVVSRLVAFVVALVVNVFDLLVGFLNWPPKHLTLYVLVLSKLSPADRKRITVDLNDSIAEAKRILKNTFNVKLRPYASQYVEWFDGSVPTSALNPSCCDIDLFGEEFKEQGDFYAKHLAGWNAIPISLRFPITVFIVDDVKCHAGCSNWFFSDWVVVKYEGLNNPGNPLPNSLMTHEMGHACNLLHPGSSQPYLMHAAADRGDKAHWWQRNLFRASRHVTYW